MTAGHREGVLLEERARGYARKRDRRLARHGDQQPERLGDLRERIQGEPADTRRDLVQPDRSTLGAAELDRVPAGGVVVLDPGRYVW